MNVSTRRGGKEEMDAGTVKNCVPRLVQPSILQVGVRTDVRLSILHFGFNGEQSHGNSVSATSSFKCSLCFQKAVEGHMARYASSGVSVIVRSIFDTMNKKQFAGNPN